MANAEELEILKAVLVIAAADGQILGSEKGVYGQLAGRLGLEKTELERLRLQASHDADMKDQLFGQKIGDPAKAMQLLVATARIDGDISEKERNLLVEISDKLGIGVQDFGKIYQSGIAMADAVRKRSPFKK
ncbi:MAG: hypothetical protein ACE5GE_06430 [Phycisphaerae bacterium]